MLLMEEIINRKLDSCRGEKIKRPADQNEMGIRMRADIIPMKVRRNKNEVSMIH